MVAKQFRNVRACGLLPHLSYTDPPSLRLLEASSCLRVVTGEMLRKRKPEKEKLKSSTK